MLVVTLIYASVFNEIPWALQDTSALRGKQFLFAEQPQHVKELHYVEKLEDVKAKILLLEQQFVDQPGSKDLQDKLVDAREWQKIWERNLNTVQTLGKFLLSDSLRAQGSRFLPHVVTKHLRIMLTLNVLS